MSSNNKPVPTALDNDPVAPSPNAVATIDWDEHNQPHSRFFGDIYYTHGQGLAESQYVFLQHNDLAKRFAALNDRAQFIVGETGFGTGLNFLACWHLWQQQAPRHARLTYIAVEKYPLRPADLKRALNTWTELTELSSQLIRAYSLSFTGRPTPCYHIISLGQVRLLLLADDAEQGLKQLLACQHPQFCHPQWQKVDAWFLDGFAPAKNPQMWTQTLFQTMALLSGPEASFATFTAAGSVKRNLLQAGFRVDKAKGFGGKREMLRGWFRQIEEAPALEPAKTPWARSSHYQAKQPGQSIAVIGAGLAGCHTARALARRGYQVTLIDRHQGFAREASGNLQGVVYTKLSPQAGMLGEFNLSALLYAQQIYQDYWQCHPVNGGDACGVLHLSHDQRSAKHHRQLAKQLQQADFVEYLTSAEASTVAGVALNHDGLFFPYCGWIAPQQLCQWLTQHQAIDNLLSLNIDSMRPMDDGWLLTGREGPDNKPWQQIFDSVVITSAVDASHFDQTHWLPTKPIRGQVSYLSAHQGFNLRTVICGEGYMAPATSNGDQGSIHTIGASFNLNDSRQQLSSEDHRRNIERISHYLPELNQTTVAGGRVGFRCTSPDYLPLAGPVPDDQAFNTDYRALSHNGRQIIDQPGRYLNGLYLNIAHGSRGLAYTPLAAEIVASHLLGEAPPVPQVMADALNPARFLIRRLIRSN